MQTQCRKSLFGIWLLLATLSTIPARAAGTPCEGLSALKLPDTSITAAQVVAAGAFSSPAAGSQPAFKNLPEFCRVQAEIKPSKDSDIKIEVWMPVNGWNGKFQGLGNGGFAGSISYPELAVALKNGYASAMTDTGHSGSAISAGWALGHPEKITDFGYRAVHEMTVQAKAIMQAFYGNGPKHSYFAGCSNGGRQALMEAQRYPADYDGILAGAPAWNWTHLLAGGAWNAQATLAIPGSYISADKVPVIASAVREACDAQDGVKDGIIADPRKCAFDPATIQCKSGDTNSCLTAEQVVALKKIYAGAHDSKGRQIYPGFLPGGEEGPGGWTTWTTGTAPGSALLVLFANGFYSDMVFDDPQWDFKTFNFDSGVNMADQKQGHNLNATDPNLKPFQARGGKLIMYHGWSDAAIPPTGAIDYYNSVMTTIGAADAASSVRLFMAPGVQHCAGGPGPDNFGQFGYYPATPQGNMRMALEQWVEKGVAPETIIAAKYVNPLDPSAGTKMTRPLCAWPKMAKYKGSGDVNDAANWECAKQ